MPRLFTKTSLWRIVFTLLGVSLCAARVPSQEPLYTDTFEGAKEKKHPSGWAFFPAPDADYWYVTQGQLCTGNGDNLPGQSTFAVIDDPKAPEWGDYVLRCDAWMYQQRGQLFLVARWQNPQNYYLAGLGTGVQSTDPNYARIAKVENGQTVDLVRVVDGKGGVVLGKFPGGTSPADSRHLQFEVVGSRLTLYLDGKAIAEAQDTSFSKGSCGVGQQDNIVFFDNIVVVPVSGGGATGAAKTATLPSPAPTKETVASPAPSAPFTFSTSSAELPTGTVYRLVMADGLDRQTAEGIRAELVPSYSSVDVVEDTPGKFAVYLGVYLTRQEAESRLASLQQEGYTAKRVVEVSGQKAVQTFEATTAAPSAPATRTRVVAGAWDNQARANEMKQSLDESGYFPVEVKYEGNQYEVLCGPPFVNPQDAENLAADLRQNGYFQARVAEVQAAPAAPIGVQPPTVASAPAPISADELTRIARQQGYAPTPEEIATVQRIIQSRERTLTGQVSFEDYDRLVKELAGLSQQMSNLTKIVETSEAERQQKENRILEFKAAVDSAYDAGDYKRALENLDEWEKLDPTSAAAIDVKRRLIQNAMNRTYEGKEIFDQQQQAALQAKMKDAKDAEDRGEVAQALTLWRSIGADASAVGNSAIATQAGEAATRLQGRVDEMRLAQQRAARRQSTFLYLSVTGIVVLVLVVSGTMVIMMVRSRKRDQELLRQVQELTIKPLREIEQGAAPKLIEGDQEPAAAKKKAPPKAAPPRPAPASGKPVPLPPTVAAPALFDETEPEAMPGAGGMAIEEPPAASKPAPAPIPEDKQRIVSPQEVVVPPPSRARAPRRAAAVDPFAPVQPAAEEALEEPPLRAVPSAAPQAPAPPMPEMPSMESVPSAPPEAYAAAESSVVSLPEGLDFSAFETGGGKRAEEPFGEPVGAGVETGGGDGQGLPSFDLPVPPMEETPPSPFDQPHSYLDVPSQSELESIVTSRFGEGLAPAPGASEPAPSHLDLDSLVPPSVDLMAETVAVPPSAGEASPSSGEVETAEVGPPAPPVPSAPVGKPEAPRKAPAAAPAVAEAPVPKAGGKTIYQQDFDDEADGATPRNWTGEYDYSSLVISSQTPAPDSKRCLRFEKRQGSGSAYYSCRFDDISGRVVVEFDLRCDDKNKYLLGFYIEKDEDFRQSIHTIVHRTSPQVAPTLRVQGEPTQYAMGTWRHMKYEIDLPANSINGYVDGDLVAKGVKLASPPKSLNTLSIRDNLATTGVLLIDNIKIYQP